MSFAMLQKSKGTLIRSIMGSLKDTRSELFWVEWFKLLGHAGTVMCVTGSGDQTDRDDRYAKGNDLIL